MLLAFPQTTGEPDALLRIYFGDTKHIDQKIVAETATRFRQGRVPKQSKQFAPTPAQFIEEAEEAEKLERLRNRKPLPPPQFIQRGSYFKRLEAKKALYSAFEILFEDIGHKDYQKLLAGNKLPHPHFYVAHTGIIYKGLHPKLAGKKVAPRPHSEVDA